MDSWSLSGYLERGEVAASVYGDGLVHEAAQLAHLLVAQDTVPRVLAQEKTLLRKYAKHMIYARLCNYTDFFLDFYSVNVTWYLN